MDTNQQIPEAATHLRIGFIQYQQLVEGNAPTLLELEENAAQSHPNLKQVQIYLPTVLRIGNNSFLACQQLERVEFVMKAPRESKEEEKDNTPPSKLISIGVNAFCYCQNLQSLIGLEFAKESLQNIGDRAFQQCGSLVNVAFLSRMTGLQSIGIQAFQGIGMINLDLSKAILITDLPNYTISVCNALTSLHLPPNLLKVGDWAFWRCSTLEEIHLPPRLESIGKLAFQNCCELKSIVSPSSLKQIGWNCFRDCKKLCHISLPSSQMPFLKTHPFNDSCVSLSALELPSPVSRKEWPLILEQFCNEDGIAKHPGGIKDPKNRNTIVWTFLCRNMARLFIDDNAGMSRRRPGLPT